MLHRSLGVLAATPFQVSIANCQRSDLHQSFPTFEFNIDREKHMQLHIFSACQTSPVWHKTFVMFFCYCLVILVVDIFFFTFISGFFGATNWRIWCCFEESIAVEERDLVGTSWGSNGKWYVFCRFVPPLHWQNLCRK